MYPISAYTISHHRAQVIYALVKDCQDLSDKPLEIDPSDGEFLFLPVLDSIIENPDTPTVVRVTTNEMYHYEFIRGT